MFVLEPGSPAPHKERSESQMFSREIAVIVSCGQRFALQHCLPAVHGSNVRHLGAIKLVY